MSNKSFDFVSICHKAVVEFAFLVNLVASYKKREHTF